MELSNQRKLVHKHEELLFILCVISSVSIVIWLMLSIVGAIIFGAIALLTLLSHALSMAHIQVNGVRLRETQFPELYQKVYDLSAKMGLTTIPEVYIMESGGILNAFATKFFGLFGSNMVVLYSDYVELTEDLFNEEVEFVIAHELAHIKRNHLVKSLLVFPAMWVPFLGVAYSRSAEYTCDRMATFYTEQPERAINGLLVFAAGKRLFQRISLKEYQMQYNEKKGFFVTLMEFLSTHPPLPKRIYAIEQFTGIAPTVELRKDAKVFWIIIIIVMVMLPVLFGGIVYTGFNALDRNGFFTGLTYPSGTPLEEAIYSGDIDLVEQLLIEGEDPNEQTDFGEYPLSIAIYNDYPEIAELLIEFGANPNSQDSEGWTPLMWAVSMENLEMTKYLLNAGADPTLLSVYEETALSIAEDYGFTEIHELLTQE